MRNVVCVVVAVEVQGIASLVRRTPKMKAVPAKNELVVERVPLAVEEDVEPAAPPARTLGGQLPEGARISARSGRRLA
jgi:hypothetical protein